MLVGTLGTKSLGLTLRCGAALAAGSSLLAGAGEARAQVEPPPLAASQPTADAPTPTKPAPEATIQRPWLYTADPTGPGQGRVLASLGIGYAAVDQGAVRPFAADRTHAGAVFSAGAEVGLFRFMSVSAEGLMSGQGGSSTVHGGALVGVSFYPLPAKLPVALSVSGGYLRELDGGNGAWGRVVFAGDAGPVRLMGSALGSHVFVPGRDALDLMLTAGASVRVTSFLRLGAEYVAQDLEGAWDPEEAEGGIRHFVGPTAALELSKRVFVTAGPAFGLTRESPRVLGRLAAAYAF